MNGVCFYLARACARAGLTGAALAEPAALPDSRLQSRGVCYLITLTSGLVLRLCLQNQYQPAIHALNSTHSNVQLKTDCFEDFFIKKKIPAGELKLCIILL